MESTNKAITKSVNIDVADAITLLRNSVTLFEMKYGKYMDKHALDSLHLISKYTKKLEEKII